MAQSSIVLIFKKVFQSLIRMFSCETLIIILQQFAAMKRCAERCTLQLYCTALSTCMCFSKIEIGRNLSSLLWWRFQEWNLSVWCRIFWVDAFSLKQIPLNKYLLSHHLVAFSWFWLVLYVNSIPGSEGNPLPSKLQIRIINLTVIYLNGLLSC